MRYRIPLMVAAAMAIVGLSAPAAVASSQPSITIGCTVGQPAGTFKIKTSADNHRLGMHYNGVGKLATVTTRFSDVTLVCAVSPATYVLRNVSNHCIRMQDASNNYTVLEEKTCNLKDTNYQFTLESPDHGKHFVFQNAHFTTKFLGVNCPVRNGKRMRGVNNAPGNCVRWVFSAG